jgi:hypothetical protein
VPALRYVVADVFTDRPLAGNPVADFTDARDIPEELLVEPCLFLMRRVHQPERNVCLAQALDVSLLLRQRGVGSFALNKRLTRGLKLGVPPR